MPLQLHPPRQDWWRGDRHAQQQHAHREQQLLPLRISNELPFSSQLLRSIRVGPQSQPEAPLISAIDADATAAAASQRAIAQRQKDYEARDDRCDRALKCGQWLMLFVAIAFVAVVIVMLSMVFVKVGTVLDSVSASAVQAKVDRVLDHAMQAALNTETATKDAAAMSALAKIAVADAHPRLMDALRKSSEMIAELKDFSLHPQVTLSAGNGRRRRD